jgi:hypothetical protein
VRREASDGGSTENEGGDGLAAAVAWAELGQLTDPLPPAGGRGEEVEPAEALQSGEGGKIFGDTDDGGRLFVVESPGGAWTPEASEGESVAAEGEMPSLATASEEQAGSLPFAESTLTAAPDAAGWAPRGPATAGEGWRLASDAATIAVPNPDSTFAPGRLATGDEGVAAGDETAAEVTAPGLSAWSGESVEAAGGLEQTVAAGADACPVPEGPDDRPDAGVFEQAVVPDVREPATVPDGGASGPPFEITGSTLSAPGASARSSSWDLSWPAHPAASGSPFEPAPSGGLARADTSWDLGFPDAPVPPGPDPSGTMLVCEVPASAGYPADGRPQSPETDSDNGQQAPATWAPGFSEAPLSSGPDATGTLPASGIPASPGDPTACSPQPGSGSDNGQQAPATWDPGFSGVPLPPGLDGAGAVPPSGMPSSSGYPMDSGPQPPAGSDNGHQAVAASHGDGVPSDRRTAALRTLERWLEALERARSARSCPP